ncbi:MAG: AMP-binding protein, partial [Gemmatimonas sp.]
MSDLREKAAANPSAVAITESRGRSISRGALVATVEALVASLVERGFMAGDGVLFSVRPGIDAVALVFAVHDLGGVLLPMDPGVCDALFDARMALLKPRWVFAQGVLLSPSHGV